MAVTPKYYKVHTDGHMVDLEPIYIELVPAAQKWIPVTERLPSDEKPVLAYYGYNNDGDYGFAMMFTGTLSYFCFDPNPHWQHASTGLVVTHWMPLPEPPADLRKGENDYE